MTIGERIRQRRIDLNLTQDELAHKVGYKSRSSIQKIESARDLPLNKVSAMAAALECPPSALMGWEDIPVMPLIFFDGEDDKPPIELEIKPQKKTVPEDISHIKSMSDLELILNKTNQMDTPELQRLKAYIESLLNLRKSFEKEVTE